MCSSAHHFITDTWNTGMQSVSSVIPPSHTAIEHIRMGEGGTPRGRIVGFRGGGSWSETQPYHRLPAAWPHEHHSASQGFSLWTAKWGLMGSTLPSRSEGQDNGEGTQNTSKCSKVAFILTVSWSYWRRNCSAILSGLLLEQFLKRLPQVLLSSLFRHIFMPLQGQDRWGWPTEKGCLSDVIVRSSASFAFFPHLCHHQEQQPHCHQPCMVTDKIKLSVTYETKSLSLIILWHRGGWAGLLFCK